MATVYYDFGAGSNGTGASPASPKNTWATPGNGDVVRIKRGCTWTRATQLSFGAVTGLTIEAYANDDGTDSGDQAKPVISHTAPNVFAWNFQGDGTHRIRNLAFVNCGTNTNGGVIGSGLVAATSVNASIEITGCDFQGTSDNAIRFSGTGVAAAPRCVVKHCTFDDIGEDAVYGGALYYEFAYNRVTRVSQQEITGDGVGFIGVNPVLAWVHHNYIDHRDTDFKHCIIIDGVDGSGFALVEDNELFGLQTTCINFNNVVGTARRNRITTAGIAGSSNTAGAKWLDNVVSVNGYTAGDAATFGLVASTAQVCGNTFIVNDTSGRIVDSGTSTTGHVIKNNHVIGGGIFYKRGASATETRTNNAFDGTVSPYVTSSLVAIALDASDIATDTQANEAGRPLSGSPLIGAGTHLGYRRDADGKQRPNPPSIGAYDVATMRLKLTADPAA